MSQAKTKRGWWSRHVAPLAAIARKETLQTLRDRRMLGLLAVAPVLQLLVLGYAANLEVDRVPSVVVDLDQTTESRRAIEGLVADDTLREVARERSAEAASAWLVDGRAAVAVVIPRGFARALARGETSSGAVVQVLVDGTDPNRSTIAGRAALQYFAALSAARLRARAESARGAYAALPGQGTAIDAAASASTAGLSRPPASVSLLSRVLYNPSFRTVYDMVPGIMTMLLLIVTTIVSSMGLAREREVGTLEQVLVTPIRPWALLLGKMIPFAAIGLFDLLFALVVATYVFDVPVRGSIPLLFGVTLVFLVTTLGLGLLISTVSETQQQAYLAGLFMMLPAILLSGIMTPIESMPSWLEPLTYVNPLRWFSEILRGVMIRGVGLDAILRPLGMLALEGGVIMAIAARRFRKTVA